MPDLATLDITDVSRYVSRGYPWAEWDLLRREAPVFWYEREGFAPFWAITRHEDVLTVSKNSRVFVNSGRLRLATIEEDARMERGVRRRAERLGWDPEEPLDLVFMDDPRHREMRLLTADRFTPRALRRLEPELDAMSREFASAFREQLRADSASNGHCDFVEAFAAKLPLATIGRMLGLPEHDWMHLKTLTNVMLNTHEPSYYRPGESRLEAIDRASSEIRHYLRDVIAKRRADGATGDDLASVLVRAKLGDAPLSDQQLHGYLFLLLAAGNETTRNAMTGGVQALLQHPEQRDLLCEHPELTESAVEEILRWTSPVVQFARTAVEDFELRSTKIHAGQHVGMFYPSANRDEAVFDEPYRFDIRRHPNHHLAFGGYGAHFCLGANLARWELRSGLRALIPLLREMELAGRETRVPHLHVPAFQHLPVRPI